MIGRRTRYEFDEEEGGMEAAKNIWNSPKVKWGRRGLAALAAATWIGASSIYMVSPSEEGVVTRFGKYDRSTENGIHLKLPWPVENAYTPEVSKVRRIEIGFRTIEQGPPAKYEQVAAESLMLTGDENIVDLDFIVQYNISDAPKYLFKVNDPEGTIRDAAEASMRQVIGDNSIDAALTTGKAKISESASYRLQEILNGYDMGVKIVNVQLQDVNPPAGPVSKAFQDVASAKEDKSRLVNEAKSYYNDMVPKARGGAAQIIQDAEAYSDRVVKTARGDIGRFSSILKEYEKAPEITSKRYYIETMSSLYSNPNVDKYMVGDSGIFKLLNLDQKMGGGTEK